MDATSTRQAQDGQQCCSCGNADKLITVTYYSCPTPGPVQPAAITKKDIHHICHITKRYTTLVCLDCIAGCPLPERPESLLRSMLKMVARLAGSTSKADRGVADLSTEEKGSMLAASIHNGVDMSSMEARQGFKHVYRDIYSFQE